MKASETKQLKEALQLLKECFTQAEVMTERAKERECWSDIMKRMGTLIEPFEVLESEWGNKLDNLSERQRETYKGEIIEDVAGKYETIVSNLKDVITDIEYLIDDL